MQVVAHHKDLNLELMLLIAIGDAAYPQQQVSPLSGPKETQPL